MSTNISKTFAGKRYTVDIDEGEVSRSDGAYASIARVVDLGQMTDPRDPGCDIDLPRNVVDWVTCVELDN